MDLDGGADAQATLEQKVKLQTRWEEEDYMRAVAGKDRAGVLEGYGSTVLPGIKAEEEEGLAVGFCGAFTTFSSLTYETWSVGQASGWWLALVNLGGSAVLGMLATFLGIVAARALWR